MSAGITYSVLSEDAVAQAWRQVFGPATLTHPMRYFARLVEERTAVELQRRQAEQAAQPEVVS